MNLHSFVQKLRRVLVPAAMILLIALSLAKAARSADARQPDAAETTGRRGYFQVSPFPTSTWTPTPTTIPPTPTDTPTPIPPTPTPTDTPTPIPPTPTPTDTPTPIPPTPTWTATPTPTPIPPTPTPTDTPVPPTPTDTPTPIPPTPTPTPTAVPLPPELSALTIQPSVVEIEVDILAGAVFTDPDPRPGTHIAEWDWGDGSPLTVKEVEPGLALANHAYLDAGIYTVAFKVTNPIGLSTAAHPESVVVFDPSGGFVTGAGWINSTAGAYCPDPSLVGKANFGFVSKYVKGKQAPTGNTQFQFKTAGLTFSSEDYDWLVVTGGDSANFKGTGTINGQLSPAGDPYKFKVWAGDGEPDTLRIRIWYEYEALEDMEFVIYDNVDLLCDEVDDGGPKQPIGGGQIIVHAGKGK